MMSQILSAAPTHKWTLNETGSPFLDTIGSTSALCSGAECPTQVAGQIGSALEFDGVNDKLTISQNNLTSFAANDSYSIELWLKTDSPSLQVAFGRGGSGNYVWIGTQRNKIKFEIAGGPIFQSSNANLEFGVWTHVVMVKDVVNSRVLMYIDGELDSTYAMTTPRTISGTLGIGNLNGSYLFDGAIDNVAIFNNSLTASQVEQLHSGDIVKSIHGPAIITRGQSVTLSIDYVASQERTLAVYLKTTTGTKEEYFYRRVNAPEGDRVKQVTFSVPANAPINATYKYGTYIAAKGKYFNDNLGKAYMHGVIIVSVDTQDPWDHGVLKVSSDNHMLQHADGTGFFWMADTAWDLYKKTRDDIDLYMNNRADKKFTVIQAVAMHYHRSSSNGERPFIDNDLTQPNEVYWEHIDYMISKAEEHGIYVALLPTWHSAIEYGTFSVPNDARVFGEWIARRYRDRPNIIWVPGGDTPIDGSRVPSGMTAAEEVAIWNALGSAINRVDSNHLITFHPLRRIPSVQLGNPSWLDFNMLQSGRGTTSDSVQHLELGLREGLAVIDGESLYEGIAYSREGENARRTAFQVRDDAYSSLFAGAFGNTYGHDAIYRFWESTAPGECTAYFCTPNMIWRDAIDAPGGVQMKYVTELMQSRPILGRLPNQTLIRSTPSSRNGIVATLGNGFGMIYSAQGESFTVEMGKVSGTEVKAWWYNPREGVSTLIGEFGNSGTQTFNPPGQSTNNSRNGNDWVLVLDDVSRGFAEPGR